MMKRQAIFVGLGVLFLIICVAFDSDSVSWHSMSQAMRNQSIVDRSYAYLGKKGGQCKVWVRTVVFSASGGAVSIPSTMDAPYDYLWKPGAYVVGMSTNIRNVKPGWIVQMKWKKDGIPHTLIVVGVISSGMYVVESNYNWDEKVGLRFWTFSDFDTKIGSRYSVYYIL